jgi:DNA (cytosine-5)-methyltransferase 1
LNLVLSLFPGIGLLDQAFEEAGFSVVRGPDLLWGGDIRSFHVPAGRFDGVIGGPPCQRFSGLGNVNRARWGEDSVMPDMIPDYIRVVEEAQPEWFVMENVPMAPVPSPLGYAISHRQLDNRWVGGEQRRRRRFTFGVRGDIPCQLQIETVALEAFNETPTVVSTGQADWKGSAKRHRATIEYMAEAQGIDPSRFNNTPFTTTELRRAIANGVPLPMGRAIAKAVIRAKCGGHIPSRSAA